MYDRAPHSFHPADTPRPALPTKRTGSHRSSLIALLVVVGLFATLAGLWVLTIQRQDDQAHAEAAADVVRSVADAVNAGAPMSGDTRAEAVAIALRDERQVHAAARNAAVTRTDLPAEVDVDAAYLVDVEGQLGCLLLRGDRAGAYADGRDVTRDGAPPRLPVSFNCTSLHGG